MRVRDVFLRRHCAASPLLAAVASFALLGCGERLSPCLGSTCGAARECLANRCMPSGATPVAPNTERVVAELSAFASAESADAERTPTVTLGGRRAGGALYLAFDPAWKAGGAVEAAFLLLSPSPGVDPNPEDLPLDIWTVGEPWSPERVASGDRPSLEPPRARGILRPSPPSGARIDVTEIARALERRDRDDGLAVVARSSEGEGATLMTGSSGGAPRLEVYLRPARGASAAW